MSPENRPDRTYTVGRGKPPQKTKFKKGQSGNPKGRPKGSKNFASTIQAELKRRVMVSEDGQRKRITKREAVAKQLVNKAAAGDHKAIPVLLREVLSHEAESTGEAGSAGFSMAAEDNLVLENMIKRIRESTPTEPGPIDAPPHAASMETVEKHPNEPETPTNGGRGC